ncbi:hypothetical protein COMNV_00002 [Commensalibacter sp. Nvir]|uniref:MATE family efflux transporter n=1 Tax=Commensalibacter sp. Nvir TaxID=3069817 RepID=UPI002D6FF119|nr:hypothetical protein COMNV_00002 [Commensalibacter sp. Nvir]
MNKPRFCEGSIFRHVIVMAGTGAIGLMSIFIVDFFNLFYLSTLGNSEITAAIGFANAINFLQLAICIGMTIGITVITARLVGARKQELAQRIVTCFLVVTTVLMLMIGICIASSRYSILYTLGARDKVLEQASHFTGIVSPFSFLIALGMITSGLLRAVGNARKSMNITVLGALVAALLDPLFILGFHLGIKGAAISTILSRLTVVTFGFYFLIPYNLLQKPNWHYLLHDSYRVFKISFPAILTNLASPVASLFIVRTMSRFGNNAISGQTAIDRIVPLAFSFIFALTGSVGPIISQNFGAGIRKRVYKTLTVSLKLVLFCAFCTWIFFFFSERWIIKLFSLKAEGAELMELFCHWVILSNLFLGLLFVSNTVFNNLEYPLLSTLFNWGRATLGTIPFIWIGSAYGPKGVLIGQALGVVPFGILSVICSFYIVKHVKMDRPFFN